MAQAASYRCVIAKLFCTCVTSDLHTKPQLILFMLKLQFSLTCKLAVCICASVQLCELPLAAWSVMIIMSC